MNQKTGNFSANAHSSHANKEAFSKNPTKPSFSKGDYIDFEEIK